MINRPKSDDQPRPTDELPSGPAYQLRPCPLGCLAWTNCDHTVADLMNEIERLHDLLLQPKGT